MAKDFNLSDNALFALSVARDFNDDDDDDDDEELGEAIGKGLAIGAMGTAGVAALGLGGLGLNQIYKMRERDQINKEQKAIDARNAENVNKYYEDNDRLVDEQAKNQLTEPVQEVKKDYGPESEVVVPEVKEVDPKVQEIIDKHAKENDDQLNKLLGGAGRRAWIYAQNDVGIDKKDLKKMSIDELRKVFEDDRVNDTVAELKEAGYEDIANQIAGFAKETPDVVDGASEMLKTIGMSENALDAIGIARDFAKMKPAHVAGMAVIPGAALASVAYFKKKEAELANKALERNEANRNSDIAEARTAGENAGFIKGTEAAEARQAAQKEIEGGADALNAEARANAQKMLEAKVEDFKNSYNAELQANTEAQLADSNKMAENLFNLKRGDFKDVIKAYNSGKPTAFDDYFRDIDLKPGEKWRNLYKNGLASFQNTYNVPDAAKDALEETKNSLDLKASLEDINNFKQEWGFSSMDEFDSLLEGQDFSATEEVEDSYFDSLI